MRIRELRESRKLTQDELGDKLKVGRSAVAMWESGKSNPTADKIPELAKILNCKIEDLFENDDQVDGDSGNERKE